MRRFVLGMVPPSYRAVAGILGLTLSTGVALGASAQDTPTFTAAVDVVEAELLIDVPRGASIDGVEIVEAGASWPVDRHRPVDSAGPNAEWHQVIWIDAPLTAPGSVAAALRALSLQAAELVELGTVEIVVADPAPRRVLAPTRSSSQLEERLVALAADPPGTGLLSRRMAAMNEAKELPKAARSPVAARAVADEVAIVRRQVDWLLIELERGCGGAACSLLWISDGWPLAPGQLWRSVLPRDVSPPDGDLDPPTADLARLAAAWRWVVWPISLGPTSVTELARGGRNDFDRWRDTVASNTSAVGDVVLWRVAGSRPDPSRPAPTERDLDALLSLDAAPLRAVASATAGRLFASAAALEVLPLRMSGFRRVWYRPARALDGGLREIRLMRRGVLARDLLGPRWSRAGSPQLFTELLLRRLLAGEDGIGELEVIAHAVPIAAVGASGRVLVNAELQGVEATELEVAPPRWRVSWSQQGRSPKHLGVGGRGSGLGTEDGANVVGTARLAVEIEVDPDGGPVAIVVEELVRRQRGTLRCSP